MTARTHLGFIWSPFVLRARCNGVKIVLALLGLSRGVNGCENKQEHLGDLHVDDWEEVVVKEALGLLLCCSVGEMNTL